MTKPTVSFVVPCYKLAHLLGQCIDSILAQSFEDFEILVMDDCSPDNTMEVANSFKDGRVRYIRNEPNLGHMRNYNKGISLACGRYIWLISADDYLRSSEVLGKYVDLMDRNDRIGYCFCSGVGVADGKETEILPYSRYAEKDMTIKGHKLLEKLSRTNFVLSASGLVRRDCYETLGVFPLDMPFACDWYLWALFALHYDVAYFAEPMVAYRTHEMSMTTHLTRKSANACCQEDVAVPWAIKRKADEAGFEGVSKSCLRALGEIYGKSVASNQYGMDAPSLSLDELENSLTQNSSNQSELQILRAYVFAAIGNEYYWRKETDLAARYYRSALRESPWLLKVWVKRLLLASGGFGDLIRKRVNNGS